jgi:hypothetical protein
MVDLSVLKNFDPVIPIDTKNSRGYGISPELKKDLDLYIESKDADKLAKIIQKEAEKSKNETEKFKIIEELLARIRAKDSKVSLQVYEKLTDKDRNNGFIDVFGTELKVPTSVEKSVIAKTAWEKIMSGAAYDYIEENKLSIEDDLKYARCEADDGKILKVANNQALVNLKEQLRESGMSDEEADTDISKMLRETNDSNGKPLLAKGESVQVEMGSPSNALSAKRTEKLQKLRDELTKEIDDKAKNPEAAKQILKESVNKFEALRPDGIKPETFYTEQMQAVLDESKEYKEHTVAATASLEKITVDGKELIKTTNDKVFVNSKGEFVVEKDGKYDRREPDKDGKIEVDGTKIDREDIKASQPKISILMNTDQNEVEDCTLKAGKDYVEDQKLVHKARGDEEALEELDKQKKNLDEVDKALPERRKKEKDAGKSDDNNTLMLIVGLLGAVATVVAALSQGRGKTTTVTGGAACNPQGGAYGGQNGYGYDSYLASDKYGYNRGYRATVDAANERSNQYATTFRDNPVRTRAQIMRQNGMRLIQGQDGGLGVYGRGIY